MKVNLLLRISKIRGTVAEPLYNKGSMLYADSHKTLGRVPSITLGYFLSPFKNIVTDIFCCCCLENYTVSLGCAFKICSLKYATVSMVIGRKGKLPGG